jgi:hypothetical protein
MTVAMCAAVELICLAFDGGVIDSCQNAALDGAAADAPRCKSEFPQQREVGGLPPKNWSTRNGSPRVE